MALPGSVLEVDHGVHGYRQGNQLFPIKFVARRYVDVVGHEAFGGESDGLCPFESDAFFLREKRRLAPGGDGAEAHFCLTVRLRLLLVHFDAKRRLVELSYANVYEMHE
jgi:hypothetical protein